MNLYRAAVLITMVSIFSGFHTVGAREPQATTWIDQAYAAAARQQPEQTIRLLQRARQDEALAVDTQLLMAESLLRLNRMDEAQREADQLEKNAPDRADVQQLLGDLDARQQDWASAKQHYARAVAAQPRNASLHLRLGQALQSLGEETAADQSFARYRALTVPPSAKPNR